MVMEKTHATGGIFICGECKKRCKAMNALSGCCSAPVICPPEGFPFVCTVCNGDCELGNPSAPTYEERVNATMLHTLRDFGEGKLSEEEAYEKLAVILEDERQSITREVGAVVINVLDAFEPDVGIAVELMKTTFDDITK